MADSVASILDKLATTNQKMFLAQDDLYIIRKMSFEQFKETYGSEEGLNQLYTCFKKSIDLNIQRQALILEADKKLAEMITAAVNGEDLNNGSFIQDQHKTY